MRLPSTDIHLEAGDYVKVEKQSSGSAHWVTIRLFADDDTGVEQHQFVMFTRSEEQSDEILRSLAAR